MSNTTESADMPRLKWLHRLVNVEPQEVKAVLWSFVYFFSLLCSYYIVRPLREEMGVAGGVENLQWLFTGTFVVMLAAAPLFGWVSARYPRRQFLPYVYYFFIAMILSCFLMFRADIEYVYVARAFFIWASVFSLFIVSVFWSFMADIYSNEQATRLFGFIAAGGTTGALAGPALTAGLVTSLGPTNLLLISAAALSLAVISIHRLSVWRNAATDTDERVDASSDNAMGGSVLAGVKLALSSRYLLGICLLIVLFTTLSTFLYFQQAQIIKDTFDDPAERTRVFAGMDLVVNALTILTQVFLTGRVVKYVGLPVTLVLLPLLVGIGFVAVGFAPVLGVLVVFQIVRRAGNYAINKPAREMLFTVLGREEKYKAKNFIDTVIYRGGDAVSGWVYAGFRAAGLSLSSIAFVAVPLAALWGIIGYKLGKHRERLALKEQ